MSSAGFRDSLRGPYRRCMGKLPLRIRRRILYFVGQRRLPRLHQPRSFSELVNYRIVCDRSEALSWTCDKLVMKHKAEAAGLPVPRTLWFGRDGEDLPVLDDASRWVLKPNHRSGLVLFGMGSISRGDYEFATRHWLDNDQGELLGEWAYSKARRLCLLEERIEVSGDLMDFKVFVFSGTPALIQVDSDRFAEHKRDFFTVDWERLDVQNKYPNGTRAPRPPVLTDLLAAAARLGAEFDFIRLDFYITGSSIWFGEFSPYPGGGVERFHPRAFDDCLGSIWNGSSSRADLRRFVAASAGVSHD